MTARPFVFVNMAMTVDGKITSSDRDTPHFTSRLDKQRMDERRAEADAVLIGAGTLRADDPPLHIRDPQARARRAEQGRPHELTTIVVSQDKVPWTRIISLYVSIASQL